MFEILILLKAIIVLKLLNRLKELHKGIALYYLLKRWEIKVIYWLVWLIIIESVILIVMGVK